MMNLNTFKKFTKITHHITNYQHPETKKAPFGAFYDKR